MRFLVPMVCAFAFVSNATLLSSDGVPEENGPQRTSERPRRIVDAVYRSYPLELSAAIAVRIARIRLTGPAERHLADGTPCRNTYRATVIENFKGGTDPFDVFIPTPSDFKGFDVEYLAIVNRWQLDSNELRALLDELFSPREHEEIAVCRTAGVLYVAGSYKSIWGVDSELSKKMGEPWLEPDTRPAISWCDFEGDPPPGLFVHDGVRVGKYWYEAISLGGAQRLIRRALKNSPIQDDGSYDDSFVPGKCE